MNTEAFEIRESDMLFVLELEKMLEKKHMYVKYSMFVDSHIAKIKMADSESYREGLKLLQTLIAEDATYKDIGCYGAEGLKIMVYFKK